MVGRRASRGFRDILLTTTALVAALAGGGKGAAAGSSSGLSGFQVQSGGATLSTPSATKSIITQSTSKAIISWSAFGIPTGSTVQFIQPGSSSVALNRVTGGNVSNILGHLTANGQVWIVNPAGVFFGAGAQVDVAGLMATTSDIQNGNFLSGTYQFGIGSQNPNAGIVNQGTIRVASGGSAVLSGAQVTNQGLIEAQLGSVVLAGAKTFTVDFQGDKLLSFQVTGAVDQRPNEASGAPANALVTNSGTVSATGGTVLITARAAKNIIDNVINSTGIVEAQSAQLVNGEIVLDGGGTGLVTVSGSLDASDKSAGETGGTVKVLGNQVALGSTASIDVSGDAGGGTALVGGNFHGVGPEANAATTTISGGARINASAITSGNGGKVAVWSDTATSFGGTVTATGGSTGGSGGFVETSGKSLSIGATAKVNTSAAKGTAGTWLLDPADFTVATSGGDITPLALIADLGTSNVVIETSPANTTGGTGNIVVNSSVIYGSTNSLSLLAVGDILVNASILNTQAASGGSVNLVAGWNGTTGFSGSSGVNSPGTANIATIAGTPGAFGNTTIAGASGSVFINSAAGTTAVAVGSASGPTVVLANNVTLQGGGTAGAGAQLGFNPVLAGTNAGTSGPITVTALGNVSVLAGTAQAAFAQIGNGGYKAYFDSSGGGTNPALLGVIGVNAGGSVLVQAGGGTYKGAFAQIGNGGYRAGSGATLGGGLNVGGSITVTAETNISILGGAGPDDYAQIGHGGLEVLNGATSSSGVTFTGAISLTATSGSIDVSAGSGYHGFAMMGDGGLGFGFAMHAAGFYVNAPITVTAKNGVTVSGGSYAAGTRGGDFAMIGNGGQGGLQSANLGAGSATVIGDINVESNGSVVVSGGSGYKAVAQIGDGGLGSFATATAASVEISSNVTVGGASGVSVLGGAGTLSAAMIGIGGHYALGAANLSGSATVGGNITVRSTSGSVALVAGGYGSFAQIGLGGSGTFESAGLGGGLSIASTITVSAATSIGVSGGTDVDAFAMIGVGGRGFGYRMHAGSVSINAGISVTSSTGDVSVLGGNATQATTLVGGAAPFAQIGTGGQGALDSATLSGGATLTGYVSVTAGGSIAVEGGPGVSAWAQIGNGGRGFAATMIAASADINSPVTVIAATSLSVLGGAGTASGALIGNGGRYVLGAATLGGGTGGATVTGDVTVGALGGTLSVIGGGYQSFAQIGTGGRNFGYGLHAGSVNVASNITATAANDISVLGGTATGAFAQIGDGGDHVLQNATLANGATVSGNVTVVAGTGVSVLGGSILGGVSSLTVLDNYAQIGNGGAFALSGAHLASGPGLIAGTIGVTALGGDILQQGGSVNPTAGHYGYGLTLKDAYAQIGNGGNYSFRGATLTGTAVSGIGGNVNVWASGNVTLAGGYLALQSGYTGATYRNGALSGGTSHPGNTLANSGAQIGHGGAYSFANATIGTAGSSVGGAINVTAQGGAVVVTGGSVTRRGSYAAGAYNPGVQNVDSTFVSATGTRGQPGYRHGFWTGSTVVADNGYAFAARQVLGGYSSTPQAHSNFAQIGNGGAQSFQSATLGGSNVVSGAISVTGHYGVTLASGNVGAAGSNYAFPLAGGGSYTALFAQIGHGGAYFGKGVTGVGGTGFVTLTGDIGVTAPAGDITLFAGNGANADEVQIGHGGYSALASATLSGGGVYLSGSIGATASGSIIVQGGGGPFASAQIGHGGGYFAAGLYAGKLGIGGAITVADAVIGGAVSLHGGYGAGAFAQIGHGGSDALRAATLTNGGVSIGGSIGVTGTNGVYLTGGYNSKAQAQIGHGGWEFGYAGSGRLTIAGSIGVTATSGGVTLRAGLGDFASPAQIGDGGYNMLRLWTLKGSGNYVGGDISVTAAGGVSVIGGGLFDGGTGAFAQIGHGGDNFGSTMGLAGNTFTVTGNVTVGAGSNLVVTGGEGVNAFAQIGNGGVLAFSNVGETVSGAVAIVGNVTTTALGNISVQGGTGLAAFAQIGDGGESAFGNAILNASLTVTGDVTVGAGQSLVLTGGAGNDAEAQIGDGGVNMLNNAQASAVTVIGNVTATALNDVSLIGGSGNYSGAQIGHGGRGFGQYLSGFPSASVEVTGMVNVTAGGYVVLNGGGFESAAQVGHGGYGAFYGARLANATIGGPIGVYAGSGLTVQGGFSYASFAQIGHGGAKAFAYAYGTGATISGAITVTAFGSGYVSLLGGSAKAAIAQIGNGGYGAFKGAGFSSAQINGSIGVYSESGISLSGGSYYAAFAQIGHGGAHAFAYASGGGATITGNIDVTALGNISLQGGTGQSAFAQIGHGGEAVFFGSSESTGAITGTIGVTAGGSLSLLGGSGIGYGGQDAYAQIGHGGAYAFRNFAGVSATLSGDINVNVTRDLTMIGGVSAMDDFAQIGDGGAKSFFGLGGSGGSDGNITVQVGGNATLAGGSGEDDYVQIGHGGAKQGKRAGDYGGSDTGFTNSGSISLSVGGSLGMTGGTTAAGNTGSNDYVLIGHGGNEFFSSATLSSGAVLENSGDITVGAAAIIMQGGDAGGAYVQIGNGGTGPLGGQGGTSATPVTIIDTGNITVGVGTTALAGTLSLTGGNGALAYAMIGDGGPMTPPGFTGFATFADVTNQGSIVVNVGVGTTSTAQSTLALTGGAGTNPLTLGNGNTSATSCGAALAFCGGSFAQIGNGGAGASPTNGTVHDLGTITVQVGGNSSQGNIALSGANNSAQQTLGASNYAQIGDGGAYGLFGATLTGTSGVTGSVTVGASGNITLQAGTVSNGTSAATLDAGYAQIGNGGAGFGAHVSGSGSVTVMGEITVTALGSIALTAGSLNGIGSDTLGIAYAQIGNGGQGVFVSFPNTAGSPALVGDVEVQSGGDMSLTGSTARAYAQIGNGDAALTNMGGVTSFAGAFMTGNVDVRAGGTLSLASIGHNEWIGDIINQATGPAGVPSFVIIEAGTFNDGGTLGIGFNLAEYIDLNLRNNNVSVLATGSNLSLESSVGNASPQTGTLNLVSADSVVLDGSIATGGPVNVIAGWDGSGLPALSAGDFNAALVLASAAHYGNNGGTIGIGNGTSVTDVTIGTTNTNGATGGNIVLAGTVNDAGGQRTDALTLIAGTGNVTFGAVGQGSQPADFVIVSAHNVTETATDGTGVAAFQAGGLDIVTATGTVGFAGSIFTGGLTAVSPNGGTVTINAGSAVSIGPPGASTLFSIDTAGAFAFLGGQTPGNAGAVSIAASSITVSHGIESFGGTNDASGSTGAAGSGGAVSLTALAGFIQIGQGGASNQSIVAEGGDSRLGATGPGGAAGTIIAEAQTVTFSGGVYSFGGRSTTAGSSGAGGLGAPITVTALSGPVTIGAGSSGQSIDSVGGYSALGSNANAGGISVFGNGVSIAGSVFSFGRVLAGSSASGSAGGAIVLNAGAGTLSLGAGGFALLSAGGYSSGGNGAGGAINLTGSTIRLTSGSPVTIDPGSGTLSVSSSVGGNASLALLGTSADNFGGGVNLGVGTLDLSTKTAGSVTVTGFLSAAGLLTGTNPISISLLDGGNLGDPNFQNTGTNSFAGDFVFSGGLTIGALSLAGKTSFDGTTSGVTLGTVTQGGFTFAVIADSVQLNGDWTGTSARTIAPSSNIPVVLGTSAAGFFLDQTALTHLEGGSGSGDGTQVTIGSTASGSITTSPLTFNDPLTLIGSNITVNGLTKAFGSLTLEAVHDPNAAVTLGPISGSVTLAGGTGEFTWEGHDGTLTNTTINGDPGTTSSILNNVTLVSGSAPGPFIIDGFTQPIGGGTLTISPGGGGPVTSGLQNNNNPNNNPTNSPTAGPQVPTSVEPPPATGSNSSGSPSTGDGTTADDAADVVGNDNTGTPGNTPSNSGDAKPTGVPNLYQNANNGLGGGTGGGDNGGTLNDPPSL